MKEQSIRIQSEDGRHFIEMIQQEVSLLFSYPSACFQIEASAHGFSASMCHVWLSADDMHIFLAELVRLEQQRSGTASLVSMSPDEATLSLRTIDRAGHMIAQLDLTQHTVIERVNTDQRLSITFEIDVSLLPRLVRQFEQLIPTEGGEKCEKKE